MVSLFFYLCYQLNDLKAWLDWFSRYSMNHWAFYFFLENLIIGGGRFEPWMSPLEMLEIWCNVEVVELMICLSKQSKDKNNYYQDIPQLQLPTPHEMHQIVVSKKTMLRLWK